MSPHCIHSLRRAIAIVLITTALLFGTAANASAARRVATSPFQVTVSASPSRLAFFGDQTTITYVIANVSVQPATITSLRDTNGFAVAGSASCKAGTTLPRNGSCSFTRVFTMSSNYSPVAHTLTVNGTQRNAAVQPATGTVNLTFVMATSAVGVTATPATAIPAQGGGTMATITLTNRTGASATITRLQDDLNGPGYGDSGCSIGTILPAGSACSYQTYIYASGPAGSTYPISYYAAVTSAGTLYIGQGTLQLRFV
jgi:hypothetical protein